jgi:hypothetical protein
VFYAWSSLVEHILKTDSFLLNSVVDVREADMRTCAGICGVDQSTVSVV